LWLITRINCWIFTWKLEAGGGKEQLDEIAEGMPRPRAIKDKALNPLAIFKYLCAKTYNSNVILFKKIYDY
jgi:hypothetical protein